MMLTFPIGHNQVNAFVLVVIRQKQVMAQLNLLEVYENESRHSLREQISNKFDRQERAKYSE